MAKWPKYKLHDKESKTQISQRGLHVMRDEKKISNIIVTEIRETVEWFNKIKTEYGTYTMLFCIRTSFKPSRLYTLVYLALTAAGLEQFWLQTSALCSKMCTSWNTCCSSCLKIKHKNKGKHIIVVNCYYYYFIFCCQIIIQYVSMNKTCLAVVGVCMNESKFLITLLCTVLIHIPVKLIYLYFILSSLFYFKKIKMGLINHDWHDNKILSHHFGS